MIMSSLLTLVFCIIALLLMKGAHAAPYQLLTKRAPGVVGLDFDVHLSENATDLVRRGEYQSALQNARTHYVTYLALGSNKQKVGVDIDTGSSDLWVPDSSLANQKVAVYGTYNPLTSTTSKATGQIFNITYANNIMTLGTFFNDSVSFDGITLNEYQFADATTSPEGNGILGVGPVSDEALTKTENNYPNFPVALRNAGFIDKVAYSLYLNNKTAASGSILFGGKDLAKIDGDLVTLKHSGNPTALSVNLKSLSAYGGGILVNAPYILDSGTSYNYFSLPVYNALLEQLGYAGKHFFDGRPYVPCAPTGNLDFEFDGITIGVPLSEILLSDGTDQCVANIYISEYNILGDLFLRHAYVVYNLEDSSIQIGKVKYTTETNIVAL